MTYENSYTHRHTIVYYSLSLFARFIKSNLQKSDLYSLYIWFFILISTIPNALAENNSLEITTITSQPEQSKPHPFDNSLTGQVFEGKLPKDICHQSISEAEKQADIPKDLLTAIALTEAGRWQGNQQNSIIWPWSLNILGKGHFYETPELAINAAEVFFSHGISNIDIGCMQINVQYHRQAFSSIAEMFDPIYNAAYAADFLLKLKNDLGTWSNAVEAYHSKTPKIGENYGKKVMNTWEKIKKQKRIIYKQELAKSIQESKQKQISENAKKAQIRAENQALIEKRKNQLEEQGGDLWNAKKSYKQQKREEVSARARVLSPNQNSDSQNNVKSNPKSENINNNITYHTIKENQNFNTSEQWLLEKLEEINKNNNENQEIKLP